MFNGQGIGIYPAKHQTYEIIFCRDTLRIPFPRFVLCAGGRGTTQKDTDGCQPHRARAGCPYKRTYTVRFGGNTRSYNRYFYGCHRPLFPEKPAGRRIYFSSLFGGVRPQRAKSPRRAQPDAGSEFPARTPGDRYGRGSGDRYPQRNEQTAGIDGGQCGFRQTVREYRFVQPGPDDEFPTRPAGGKRLQQLRFDPDPHQRARRAVLADPAGQPPHIQFPGYGIWLGTITRIDGRAGRSDPRRRVGPFRLQCDRGCGEHHHQGAPAQPGVDRQYDQYPERRPVGYQHVVQRGFRHGRLPRGGLPVRDGEKPPVVRPQRGRFFGYA